MTRRYAEDTSVAVSRSRGEIDKLLRDWGARQVVWGDDWETGQVMLRFLWRFEDRDYGARIVLQLPSEGELELQARHGGQPHRKVLKAKLERLRRDRGKSEHRLLHLWLKASFYAIDAGLVSAETLFLPFLEGSDGQTVSEYLLPKLPAMLKPGGARNLLKAG